MQVRDSAEHGHGHAKRAEGDWRRVEYQCVSQSLERRPTNHDEDGGYDRHGCAEACDSFEQGAEAEAEHHEHDAPIVRQVLQNPIPEGVEPARDDGGVIDRESGHDDPHDRPEGKDAAGDSRVDRDSGRHMPADDRHEKAHDQASQSRLPTGTAQDAEENQHDNDRQRPYDKGQAKATADRRQQLVEHLALVSPVAAQRTARHYSWLGFTVPCATTNDTACAQLRKPAHDASSSKVAARDVCDNRVVDEAEGSASRQIARNAGEPQQSLTNGVRRLGHRVHHRRGRRRRHRGRHLRASRSGDGASG